MNNTKSKLKDNLIFRTIVISVCILMCFCGQFIPPIYDATHTNIVFSSDAFGVLFIFIGTLILWLTISIDWPSLLCIFSLSILGSLGFNKIIPASFGSPTLIFLLFTFICTYALSKTSFLKRIALGFVSTKISKKGGYYFISMFLIAVLFLGLFMSPSVLFVVMLPILKEIFNIAKINKEDKEGKVLMMGLGFSVSISSGMTTIAHVFPILALKTLPFEVSTLSYTLIAFPTGLAIFIAMLFMFKIFFRLKDNKLKNIDVSALKNELEKIDIREIIILSIFILVILLWVVPTFFKGVSIDFYNFFNKFGSAMPPLLGTILLCVIRVKKKPLLELNDAFKNGVPWSAIIMCAGALALGFALTSDAVGIKAFLTNNLNDYLTLIPGFLLLLIFVAWAAVQTNLSSNMVTATLVATVASSILTTTTTSINAAATVCLIGMLASFAFATPPSMPHIAIISGSNYCDSKDVFIYGGALMVISILFALLIGYPLGMLIF